MLNIARKSLLARWTPIVGVISTLLGPGNAEAYQYSNVCWQNYHLDPPLLKEIYAECSFPELSEPWDVLFQHIGEWDRYYINEVYFGHVPCSYNLNDGKSSVAMVLPNNGDLAGNIGMTLYDGLDYCVDPWQNPTYEGADVLLRNDLNWQQPDERRPINRELSTIGLGRYALLHEMTHQFNLAHTFTATFSNMDVTSSWHPLMADGYPRPLPDDIRGVNALYGNKTGYGNVMVTTTKLGADGTLAPVASVPTSLYVGGSVTMELVAVNQDIHNPVWVKDRVIIQNMAGTYWVVAEWGWYQLAAGEVTPPYVYTWTYNGGLPAGDYDFRYEVHRVDSDTDRVDDNNTRLPFTIHVY